MKLQQIWVVVVLCLQAFGAFIWDPSQIIKQQASDTVHDVSTATNTLTYR